MNFGVLDFFKDISNFATHRRILGVDIGTTVIKVVELARKGEEITLENYGILETKGYLLRGNEAIQTSSLKISENETAVLLKTLLNEVKPKTDTAVATIPIFSVFTIFIEIPLLSPEETEKAISFQARQYIPLPISEVKLDWVKIEEFDSERGGRYQRLLLTAIPNEILRKYKTIFERVGLKLAAVEIEPQAMARALVKKDTPPVMIVDFGACSTGIAVVDKGEIKHTSQTDYSGISLTQALAHSLDISVLRAEELKRRRGLLGTEGEYELSTSLFPFLDVIIQECERAQSVYERKFGKKIEGVILIGGGATLPGISQYFSNRTKINLIPPAPFRFLKYPKELEPAMKSLSNDLSSAIGAAMRFYI